MTLRSLVPALCLWPALLVGQVTIGPEGPKAPMPPDGQQPKPQDGPEEIRLTITPAAEPTPALKYRFDVPLTKRQPGNSVPFVYRALIVFQQNAELRKQVEELQGATSDKPLSEFPVEKVRPLVEKCSSVLAELERGTLREETDWSWRLDQLSGIEGISFLLPEIQESRSLARLLQIKARLEIAEGRYDDATHTLRTGYALGRIVAEPPFIICGLVGIAIQAQMDGVLLDWIGKPGSPNVYWAMTSLSQPEIDLRPAMEYELDFPSRFAPWLDNVENESVPPAVWQYRVSKLFGDISGVSDGAVPTELSALAFTAIALRLYPSAKETLKDNGINPDRVEAMPVGQVLAIRQKQIDERIADELLKGSFVDAADAIQVGERAEQSLKTSGLFGVPVTRAAEPLPLMTLLAPATRQAQLAQIRLQTKQSALRVLEAIRLHAAATGHLPKSLEDIKIVPVPVNPSNGKPFDFRLDGTTALLDTNISGDYPTRNWHCVISLAEPAK